MERIRIPAFKANDGTIFVTQRECLAYESHLDLIKHEQKKCNAREEIKHIVEECFEGL